MIKQPLRKMFRHLKFEYSDLRANYPMHDMLTLSKTYAVKTGRPHFVTAKLLFVVKYPIIIYLLRCLALLLL